MKVTIELTEGDLTAERLHALNSLIVGTPGVTFYSPDEAKEKAREIHGDKKVAPEFDPDTTPPDVEFDPAGRIYGEKGEKSRRTKDEVAQDDAIAERWAALWPSKKVPAKPVEELEALLDKVETRQDKPETGENLSQDEGEDGFDIGDTDDEDADDPMDLDEFRAILVKHRSLGNATLGKLMAPHKNPGQVPEGERRAYADKIIEAAGA